jgi:nucleoside-diphosphate-sugar epimerase
MARKHSPTTASFGLDVPAAAGEPAARSVLVTGAEGNIGSYFAEHSHRRYPLRLMVRPGDKADKSDRIRPFGEVVEANLDDLPALKRHCRGMDTIVHLAADASPSVTWDSILPNNIVGTYNLFVAAKSAGCRRVIYASSVHAISGYPPDIQVKPNEPVNPGDLYGVSKCFGEAMARYMAEQEGISAVCIRIGAFQPAEVAKKRKGVGMMDAWVSQRDLNQLIQKCIDAQGLRFAIFHGLSNNRFKRMDISNARELVGYAPQDDLTELNQLLRPLRLREKVSDHSGENSGLRKDL